MFKTNSAWQNFKHAGIIFWSFFKRNLYCGIVFSFKYPVSFNTGYYYRFLYFHLYNLAKRRSVQNIVIGGAAGAFPPVIGWAIANNNLSIEPIILFLIIFFWTPSHFWSLSLYKSEDYKKAKIPMLPVVSGVDFTKKNIFAYALILFPITILPFYFNFAGPVYLIPTIILGLFYIFLTFKLLKANNKKDTGKFSKKIFAFSILYLFLIFTLLLIESFIKFF